MEKIARLEIRRRVFKREAIRNGALNSPIRKLRGL